MDSFSMLCECSQAIIILLIVVSMIWSYKIICWLLIQPEIKYQQSGQWLALLATMMSSVMIYNLVNNTIS